MAAIKHHSDFEIMPENTSLDLLNPIVWPEPVPLWPLATGWYVTAFMLAVLLGWMGYRALKRWQANAYRREALAELAAQHGTTGLPALLKRTALTAYGRDSVASLSGRDWHRFLDQAFDPPCFEGKTGALLDSCSYGAEFLNPEQEEQLRHAAEQWLKQHKPVSRK